MRAAGSPFVLAASIAAATAMTQPVSAICGAPPPVSVTPWGDGAPLNARIVVKMPATWEKTGPCALRRCPDDGAWTLAVATAPLEGAARLPVPADVVSQAKEASSATVVVAPRAPLAPHVRYEVWMRDAAHPDRSRLVGGFTTGDVADHAPPTWRGVTGKPWLPSPAAPVIECGDPRLMLDIDRAADDLAPPEQILYGIWLAADGAAVDDSQPPRTVVHAIPAPRMAGQPPLWTLVAGSTDGFEGDDLVIPPKARSLTIVVRPFDAAGNAGPRSEVKVRPR